MWPETKRTADHAWVVTARNEAVPGVYIRTGKVSESSNNNANWGALLEDETAATAVIARLAKRTLAMPMQKAITIADRQIPTRAVPL
jgi:hypothetical protein